MSSASGDAVAQLLSRQVVQMSTCKDGRTPEGGEPDARRSTRRALPRANRPRAMTRPPV